MAKRQLDQNDLDLIDAMQSGDGAIARFVKTKLEVGVDPRDLAVLLRYEADKIEGWCRGRFG